MALITLDIRGTFEKNIPSSEIEMWDIVGEWYLPKLIKSEIEKQLEQDIEKDKIIVKVWEDYDCVMSIIESIRHGNTPLIFNKKKIGLLIVLAEKWCCPKDLICKFIYEKELMENKLKGIEHLINPTQCRNCKIGYDIHSPRIPNECKFHTSSYYSTSDHIWSCCGAAVDGNYCREGLHTSNMNNTDVVNNWLYDKDPTPQ